MDSWSKPNAEDWQSWTNGNKHAATIWPSSWFPAGLSANPSQCVWFCTSRCGGRASKLENTNVGQTGNAQQPHLRSTHCSTAAMLPILKEQPASFIRTSLWCGNAFSFTLFSCRHTACKNCQLDGLGSGGYSLCRAHAVTQWCQVEGGVERFLGCAFWPRVSLLCYHWFCSICGNNSREQLFRRHSKVVLLPVSPTEM